jgi:hypothetical protein
VNIRYTQAAGDAVELGIMPGNGKGDRSVEQDIEVIGVVGVFPEVIAIE